MVQKRLSLGVWAAGLRELSGMVEAVFAAHFGKPVPLEDYAEVIKTLHGCPVQLTGEAAGCRQC